MSCGAQVNDFQNAELNHFERGVFILQSAALGIFQLLEIAALYTCKNFVIHI